MSEKVHYFKLGLFVIIALGLSVAGIIALSAGLFSKPNLMMETYLDESVQGLDVGAPIKLRGVRIGQVDTITFVNEVYATDLRYVLVRFSILPSIAREVGREIIQPMLKKEIEAGLRLRLAQQGLTGTAYLEADYFNPEQYAPLKIDFTPACCYVPSVPSLITRLSDSANSILRQMERARVDQVGSNLNTLITTLHTLLTTNLQPTLQAVQQASAEMAGTVTELRRELQPVIQTNLPPLLSNATAAAQGLAMVVRHADQTITRIENLVDRQEATLDETLDNFREASAEIKDLSRTARAYPSYVLFGEPPPRVESNP